MEIFRERLSRLDPKLGKTQLEIIVDTMILRARQGSYKDKKLLFAYGLGMPRQSVEVDAKIGFVDALTRIRARQQQLPANAVWTASPQAEPTLTDSPAVAETRPEIPETVTARAISRDNGNARGRPDDEITDDAPRTIWQALDRPQRESRQINDESTLGSWRRDA
jgi:hypothetical protein